MRQAIESAPSKPGSAGTRNHRVDGARPRHDDSMHRLATFKGLLPPIDRQAYHEGLRAMAPLGVAISVWGLSLIHI